MIYEAQCETMIAFIGILTQNCRAGALSVPLTETKPAAEALPEPKREPKPARKRIGLVLSR